MTDDGERLRWARSLQEHLRKGREGAPQLHFAVRLAALLGTDAQIQYVETSLESSSANGLSGSIVVFTDELVAVAALYDTMSTSTGFQSDTASVEVEVVARATLQALELPRDVGGEPVNHDGVWVNAHARSEWPYRGVLHLRYPERTITLRGSDDAVGFERLLATLRRDLFTRA